MQKSLDLKLARFASDSGTNDFILADAKDADMAYGIAAPGVVRGAEGNRYRTVQEYRELMRAIVEQQLVDIMLMSVSNASILAAQDDLFSGSSVTPAIRANDTTDIWLAGSDAQYGRRPSLPFRSAALDDAMGRCAWGKEVSDDVTVDLGLYSITLNNDVARDRETLEAYCRFREEAFAKKFRHFLEVFAPNAPGENMPKDVARFVNDSIVRLLAGVSQAMRPIFLKIPYFGPGAMEELSSYDSSLVVGILGGAAGTTFDAFHMLWEAKTYGARAALFGRKINQAEDQVAFVEQLRAIADGNTDPTQAVRAYHAALERSKTRPHRSLEDDLQRTSQAAAYG